MNEAKTLRETRDRFIAFAFAASDLLIEITKKGDVVFIAGQVQSLTGYPADKITGQHWLNYFAAESHDNLKALIKGAQKAGRIGPIMVLVKNEDTRQNHKALIIGMTIPESDSIYLTLNTSQAFFDFLDIGDYQDTRLLGEKQFEAAAMKAFQTAKKNGKNLDITFLEVDKLEEYKKSLSLEEANNFNENFQAIIKEQSFENNTASQVDDNRYAIVHDTEITSEFIERKIHELLSRSANSDELKDLGITAKTVEADMSKLNEREARRALIYTINQIEKDGLNAAGDDLAQGFDDYLHKNAAKITRLKALVGQQAFKLHYQPIVYLPDETIAHYEALVRFTTDDSPYELITFGEDIGIAPEIDIAILKQAIGYIQSKVPDNPRLKVAVNISGQSIQNERFIQSLMETLGNTKVSPENLLFEITESTAIADLNLVNKYIQRLRQKKFEVCLDDFGAGAASFQYLNALDIDCVKIDGKYIRDALNSPRDEAMVRNLARMCQDLGVATVAEMVENQEQLDYLISIGVDKAQGWLFGKAEANADYQPRKK